MQIGAIFPQTEISDDPDCAAEFGTAAEALGYSHILVFDHVVGAGTDTRPDWSGPYNADSSFYEPFVLYAFLAAITQRIELATGVIILPQRQTALVAKQAASLDVLCRGRLRLGVGTGWNAVEYEALGENFHNRGIRSEEQIELMRALWARELVTYQGKHHTVTNAGLKPLPPRRNIPIWLGGMAPQVIERTARLADGWFPFVNPKLGEQIETLKRHADAAGRDPSTIGIECIVAVDSEPATLRELAALGVTKFSLRTMGRGLDTPAAHIEAIETARERLDGLFE
jgi:probable F420-dependent oxidoreductase